MTEPHSITLHTLLRSQDASPSLSQLERQRLLAQSICHPRERPARIHTSDPYAEQVPIQPIPNTRSYSTTVPSTLSPLKRPRPRSTSPSLEDWQSLSNFKHWTAAPSPPPQPVSHPGILRRRTIDGKATVGAWSTSSLVDEAGTEEVERKGKKKKKTVRMEYPASTAVGDSSKRSKRINSTRNTEVGVGTSEGESSLRRSSRGRAKSTKELVPATPDEGVRGRGKEDEEKDPPNMVKERKEQPELGLGAIKRCIPPPYHHLISHTSPSASASPSRQVPCKILHSFVDPSFSPSSYPPTLPSSKTHPNISLVSPLTASFLERGRQGSWLLPISSPLPIPNSSPPIWFSSPPTPLPQSTSTTSSTPPPPSIEWSDSRLKALWAFLTHFNQTSSFGRLRATCLIPPSHSTSNLPEYLKITMDSDLALSFRTLLCLFTVEAIVATTTSQATKGKRKEMGGGEGSGWMDGLSKSEMGDKVKWLKGRGLVWVDEMGRAILVA